MRVSYHEVASTDDLIGTPREPAFVDSVPARLREAQWTYCEQMLSMLTPLERAAFELHVADGIRDREIAELFGTSPGTIRVSRLKARRKLGQAIRERPPTGGGDDNRVAAGVMDFCGARWTSARPAATVHQRPAHPCRSECDDEDRAYASGLPGDIHRACCSLTFSDCLLLWSRAMPGRSPGEGPRGPSVNGVDDKWFTSGRPFLVYS